MDIGANELPNLIEHEHPTDSVAAPLKGCSIASAANIAICHRAPDQKMQDDPDGFDPGGFHPDRCENFIQLCVCTDKITC